jgi:hypothetical protein
VEKIDRRFSISTGVVAMAVVDAPYTAPSSAIKVKWRRVFFRQALHNQDSARQGKLGYIIAYPEYNEEMNTMRN